MTKSDSSIPPKGGIELHLYEKRQKIYPREVHGIFANLRIIAVVVLLGLFYGIPWLQWNGRQAVLFDLPARKFHVFGLTFWPQDFFYLTGLLILAALSLFFFTTLAGRLWCGYACPQTVWTETFLWIERLVEGNRSSQIRLDRNKGSRTTLVRKAIKHTLWVLFALFTGFSFVGYFTPIRELLVSIVTLTIGGWALFWVLFYAFATYGNAGWMREQVCKYMCPYARFQSAMFDKDTMIISYDVGRGEPRTRGKKRDNAGDCIDCTLCVQACPTGIDIRDGLQYECIGCAACIDACDEVMVKLDKPKGLVRYTTENALMGKPTQVFRPRVFIYATVLCALLGVLIYSISIRTMVEVDVIRDRNALYRELADGTIENSYTLKLMNKSDEPHEYEIVVRGLEGAKVVADTKTTRVDAGAVRDIPVLLKVDYKKIPAMNNKIDFIIRAVDVPGIENTREARFLAPDMS